MTRDERTWVSVSYVPPIAVLLLMLGACDRSQFIRFHSIQSLLFLVSSSIFLGIVGLVGLVLTIIGIESIHILSIISVLLVTSCWVFLVIRSYKGEMVQAIIIGNLSRKICGIAT